jgi:hypothetical protein
MTCKMKQNVRSLTVFLGRAICGLACVVLMVGTASSQEPKYESWKQVEAAPETRDFLTAMKGGGDLDATARTYLEEIVLPQFALPENAGELDELRNRLKTRILGSFSNETVQNAANELVTRGMQRLVDDDALEMGVRLNAVLMIGELEAKAGGLWPGAVQPLAEIVSDKSAAFPLRIAAMAGLGQHLSRAGNRSDPSVVGAALEAAEPALLACLAAPDSEEIPGDFVASEWLTSQVLRVVPDVMPQVPPEMATSLFGILADQERSLDVRIRAAFALGTTADDRATFDVAEAVSIVEALATEALATDVALAERRAFERDILRVSGNPGPLGGGMMGSDSGFAGMGPMGGMGPGRMGAGSRGPGGMGSMGMSPGEEGPGESGAGSSRSGRPGGTAAAGRGPGGMRGPGMGSSMMGSEMGGPGSGMGSGMMGPGMPGPGFGRRPPIVPLLEDGICLRTAWRLQTLANSLASGDPASTGFVMRAPESEKAAILELATMLREQAAAIQKTPTDRSIKAAFAVVAPDLANPLEDEPEESEEDMQAGESSDTFSSGVFDDSPFGDAAADNESSGDTPADDSPFGDSPSEETP